jgi:branched-chain amino acid transport system ATP-binding protein
MTIVPVSPRPEPLLVIRDIEVVYDHVVLGLRGVSLAVAPGQIVALLGANGAGKSTTLKAASGLLAAERGAITRGEVTLHGRIIAGTPAQGGATTLAAPRALVRDGMAQVLEGRHCFAHLSVEENLIAGALVRRPSRRQLAADLERIYTHFPRLALRRRGPTGYLSGGEQQMVAIGRALMSRPHLLLLDEPSMGLAPIVVHEIFEIVRQLNQRERVSVLLAEQNATLALRFAHHGYVLENGQVVAEGPAAELAARADVKAYYLGGGGQPGKTAARHQAGTASLATASLL